MSEKIVKIDVEAAKKKLQAASSTWREAVALRKDKALSKVLDKGLEVTKKQLKYLEGLKKNKK